MRTLVAILFLCFLTPVIGEAPPWQTVQTLLAERMTDPEIAQERISVWLKKGEQSSVIALTPEEWLTHLQLLDQVLSGEWRPQTSCAISPQFRRLMPRAFDIFSLVPRIVPPSESPLSDLATKRLARLVNPLIGRPVEKDVPYIPSSLIQSLPAPLAEREEALYNRWSVQGAVSAEIAVNVLNDVDTFTRTLDVIANENQQEYWDRFTTAVIPILEQEAEPVMAPLLGALTVRLVEAQNRQVRPTALWVDIRNREDQLQYQFAQGEKIHLDYQYLMEKPLAHRVHLALLDGQGHTVAEHTHRYDSPTTGLINGSAQFDGIPESGVFTISMNVETVFGGSSHLADSLMVLDNELRTVHGRWAEVLSTLDKRLHVRKDQLAAVSAQQQRIQRQLQAWQREILTLEQQLLIDSRVRGASHIEDQWIANGRYQHYQQLVGQYNQMVAQSQTLENQGDHFDAEIQETSELLADVTTLVKARHHQEAKERIQSSVLAAEFGYAPREERPQPQKWSELVRAVMEEDPSRIVQAINDGHDVNARDPYLGRTPLHLYLSNPSPRLEVVELLVDNGADPVALDKAGNSPLLTLVSSSSPSPDRKRIIFYLQELGATWNSDRVAELQK